MDNFYSFIKALNAITGRVGPKISLQPNFGTEEDASEVVQPTLS